MLKSAADGGAQLDIEQKNQHGMTALHLAAGRSNSAMMQALIMHRANLEAKNRADMTPLFETIRHLDALAAEILVKAGANVHAVVDGFTALFYAARNGDVPMVEALIAGKAGIDGAPMTKGTPLSVASANGHLEICRLLIAHQADYKTGLPTACAAENGRTAVLELFLSLGCDPNHRPDGVGKCVFCFFIFIAHVHRPTVVQGSGEQPR